MKLLLWAGLAVAAAVMMSGAYFYVRNQAYQAAISDIAEQDQEAVNAANEIRARIRECLAADGVFTDGACIRGGG